jgi:hypothetical protein
MEGETSVDAITWEPNEWDELAGTYHVRDEPLGEGGHMTRYYIETTDGSLINLPKGAISAIAGRSDVEDGGQVQIRFLGGESNDSASFRVTSFH